MIPYYNYFFHIFQFVLAILSDNIYNLFNHYICSDSVNHIYGCDITPSQHHLEGEATRL